MKNVLIIGGSGLLGSNWAMKWKDRYNIFLGINKRLISIEGTKSIIIDFNDNMIIKNVLKKNKIDILINCSGLTNVEKCHEDPKLAEFVHCNLCEVFSKLCSSLGIKQVHISTDHLFDGSKKYTDEECLPEPLNYYGKTKLISEKMVSKLNPNALIIRTNFFGKGPSYRRSFSDYIVDNISINKSVNLFHDVYFTPIHIDELIDLTEKLLFQDLFGIYNVVGDERITKYEFGLKIASEMGIRSELIKKSFISKRKDLIKRPFDLSLSNKKLKNSISSSIKTLNQQLNDMLILNKQKI